MTDLADAVESKAVENTKKRTRVDTKTRHKAWLKRTAAKQAKSLSWRPKPTYRAAARKFLSSTDNQWRVMAKLTGWAHFRYDPKKPQWAKSKWRTWPSVGLAVDSGPDVVCGGNALEYLWPCNLTKFPDEAHQKHRALDGALEACKLKPFWICNVGFSQHSTRTLV